MPDSRISPIRWKLVPDDRFEDATYLTEIEEIIVKEV